MYDLIARTAGLILALLILSTVLWGFPGRGAICGGRCSSWPSWSSSFSSSNGRASTS